MDLGFVTKFKNVVKAWWAFSIVLCSTAFCSYLILDPGLEVTSYKVTAVLIGILISKSISAATLKLYPTMFTMFLCSLWLAFLLERYTNPEIFRDAAFEGLMLMMIGGVGLLIGELFGRFQEPEPVNPIPDDAQVYEDEDGNLFAYMGNVNDTMDNPRSSDVARKRRVNDQDLEPLN